METRIKFEGDVTQEDSYNLGELANLIQQDCDLPVKLKKADSEGGVKDGGLIIGLTVIGLVLSAIGTLVSVLSYWKSQQPKYSLTISYGGKTLSIENMSSEQIKNEFTKLQAESTNSQIEIKISK